LVYNKKGEVFSIQTINLTKRFAKKKHRGFFGFLRKNKSNNRHNNVTVALDKVNLEIRAGELFGLLGPTALEKLQQSNAYLQF
jgi:ABC-type multidrug transport system ATPase subunit